jgi:hypothetical protein
MEVQAMASNRAFNNLGTLKLGQTYAGSGTVGNGETDTIRFKLNDSGRNALTLNSRSTGSLEFVNIADRRGRFPGDGVNTRATVSSSVSGNGEGRVTNTFSGVASGVYFLRIKGSGSGENTYSYRLKYAPASADSGGTVVSSVSSSSINFSSSSGSASSASSARSFAYDSN